MASPQTFKNHSMFDPAFHFFVAPILLANIILSIYITVRDWPIHTRPHLWWIVVSLALFALAGRVRNYATKNQDRIIRLEERVRYAAVLPTAELASSQALTTRQIISLRFASDAELPALMKRTLAEGLSAKQIKQGITNWRADLERV